MDYEACKGGGQEQITLLKGRADVRDYLQGLFTGLTTQDLRVRHFEGNTQLHRQSTAQVLGRTTFLVSIQPMTAEVPGFDYTADLLTEFRYEGKEWRIRRIILITAPPDVVE